MFKIKQLVELANLFDRRGLIKAANLCDKLIIEAAVNPKVELAYKTEMDEAKRKAALNFIEVRKSITSFTHSVIFLKQEAEKVDDMIISYVKGEAISAIKGEALTSRTAPVVFENLKSKAGANDAVLYCENGGVKFIHPKNNTHIASDFFNMRVDIKQDLASEIDTLLKKLKKVDLDKDMKAPVSKGVGGVKIL